MEGVSFMELVDKILKHPAYIEYMRRNAEAEKDRQFCRHDLQHCFDVARVAYIMRLEGGIQIPKERIYVAALLHDIAKWKQYLYKIDHAAEGAVLAAKILADIGAEKQAADEIRDAIRTHRKKEIPKSLLGEILYDSDKACRPCVFCQSIATCSRFANGKSPAVQY